MKMWAATSHRNTNFILCSKLKDTYFDQPAEERDKKAIKDAQKKANRPSKSFYLEALTLREILARFSFEVPG
jgi:hypothetical protein